MNNMDINGELVTSTLPLVSIACITYNHEKYIRQCLEGFVMQKTDFKFEIVIHDDASTDKTAEIIREYWRNYPDLFKPILQNKNRYSEKKGILIPYVYPQCRGKYIALCEGDDYWTDPFKLQKQVDFLEENPEYGLVHTDFMICNSGKIIIPKRKHAWPSGDILNILLFGTYNIGTLTVVFRKNVYDELPKYYLKQNFKMGDLPLWIEFSRISKVKYLPDITSAYRVLDNSASHSSDIQKEIQFQYNICEILQFYSKVYDLPRDIEYDNFLFKCRIIKLAYLRCNKVIANQYYDQIKYLHYRIPLKIRLFYYGTKYMIIKKFINVLYKMPV